MPAIAEKEENAAGKIAVPAKFKELEEARNYLFSAVTADEDSSDSIIFNTQILALSILARLQNLVKRMRGVLAENKEMAEMLDEMISEGETAELVPTKKIVRSDVKEATEAAVASAIKELKEIAQTVISEMERYELTKTQYYVRIAGGYAALLITLKKAATMLALKQAEIDALYSEYVEYYKLHDKLKNDILGDPESPLPGWVKNLRKKAGLAKEVKDYDDFANSLEIFIATDKKAIERLGELIKLQSELRFKKTIEITDALLNAARIYA